ncbi:MAG: triose-phosphate isomerase [Christensenellales bacterium]
MNNNKGETLDFLESFLPKTQGLTAEAVICPPFTDLYAAADKLEGTAVKLGAQNMHWEEKGAFTGEISPLMLKEIPCDYVIIGHSERRQYFAETDETVNKKVKSALKHGLLPIVCVGESLAQREEGTTMTWILSQVEKALKDIKAEEMEKIVFAYEPIWAIGTGKTASAADAQEVIGAIRKKIVEMYNQDVAEKVRILYGGSVKPDNIKELMGEADIDGALVGGASLKPDSFYALCSFDN